MISVEQGSYFSVKAKLLVLGGGQLHWLRYSRLEAMKVAKDCCVGAGRGWTLSDREFVAVLGRWSRRSFLLHEHTFVDVLLKIKASYRCAVQRRELANLRVMGNAGASIHQGAGSRLHLGWQTGVHYVERAWLYTSTSQATQRQLSVDL